jgi:hypothetical protein
MSDKDNLIDEALKDGETTKEPPKKKARISPSNKDPTPTPGESLPWSLFKSNTGPEAEVIAQRRDLKRFLLKHPEIDLSIHDEIDKYVDSLDSSQLKIILDESRFRLSLGKVNANGISFLGVAGDVMARMFGIQGLSKELMADDELVEMVDCYIPSDLIWLTDPLRIINRIIFHIQKLKSISNKE